MGKVYRAAGKAESYSKIMFKSSEHTPVYERAMKHIKYAVDLKKLNLKVTLEFKWFFYQSLKMRSTFAKLQLILCGLWRY